MEEQNLEKYLVLKRSAFESGTRKSQNPEQEIVIGKQCVTKHP